MNAELMSAEVSEADRINALEAALIAARPLVAMTLEEARKGKRLLYCQYDPLNPCWNGSWSKEHGVNKHWDGDEACPECKLRAAIAAVTK